MREQPKHLVNLLRHYLRKIAFLEWQMGLWYSYDNAIAYYESDRWNDVRWIGWLKKYLNERIEESKLPYCGYGEGSTWKFVYEEKR